MVYKNTSNRITEPNHTRRQVKLKIAQINAQSSRTVTDELRQWAHKKGIDILLPEPYIYLNNVTGLGLSIKIVTDYKTIAKIKTEKIKTVITVLILLAKT